MKTRKLLLVVLAALLVASVAVVGITAYADVTPEPITPVDGVFHVENEAQLLWLADKLQNDNTTVPLDSTIMLEDDIKLTNGMTFIDKQYAGTFDGQGHTISGLKYTIFYKITGTVQNLTLEGDIDYTNQNDANRNRKAASLAFEAENATVYNVTSKVNVKSWARDLNAGAVVGYGKGSLNFENVTYSGNYVMDYHKDGGSVGGIVGYLNANSKTPIFKNCVFDGTLTVNGSYLAYRSDLNLGGIVGYVKSGAATLEGCESTGIITVNADFMADYAMKGKVGPIAGKLETAGNTLTECYTDCRILLPSYNSFAKGDYVGEANADTTYVNCKSTKLTAGTITSTEENAYTIGSADLSAFVSARQTVDKEGNNVIGYNDLRFVIAADLEGLDQYAALYVKLNFMKGEDTVVTVKKNVATELYAYATATAAGNTYTAENGSVLFGLVINQVPTGAWDTVNLELIDGNGVSVAKGQQTALNVSIAEQISMNEYNFETHHADHNYRPTWTTYIWKGDVFQGLYDKNYSFEVVANGKIYTIDEISYYGFKDAETGEYTSGYIRYGVEDAGLTFAKGETLTMSVRIYNADGNLVYVSGNKSVTANVSTANFATVEIDTETLYAKLPVASSSSSDNLGASGGEALEKMFDVNEDGTPNLDTKVCGGVSGNGYFRTFTVYFTLEKAEKLAAYSFTTGGDTASYPNRSPRGWALYGKVDTGWVELDYVAKDSGMLAVNKTVYSYMVENAPACQEYKIVFASDDNFQMQDLSLYTRAGGSLESLPAGVAQQTVTGYSAEGINVFNAEKENVPQLFDGKTGTNGKEQSKLGGNVPEVDGKRLVTVFFNFNEAKTLTYYAMTTGNDTEGGRNPLNWTLYGQSGDNWVEISVVGAPTGLGKVNNTTFYYPVQNPGAYQYYKIVFETPDKFQLNELELYTGGGENADSAKQTVVSYSCEGINVWNKDKENVAQLFDGKTGVNGSEATKMGGNIPSENLTVTVNFSLDKAATLTSYVLTTGGDTASWTARNPKAWVLYGKVGEEWVVLSDVTITGLEAANNTTFAYAVQNPQECQEYKIVFTRDGTQFQLNELELYAG